MKCEKLQECCTAQMIGQLNISCERVNYCILNNSCDKIISCKEKNRNYQFENTQGNHIVLYLMDGGVINDNTTAKCDHLLVIGGQKLTSVLVELKGNDVPHGIEQINTTLQEFPSFFNNCYRVHARIIATQTVPKIMATQKVVRLKKKLEQMNGTLLIKTRLFKEQDNELL